MDIRSFLQCGCFYMGIMVYQMVAWFNTQFYSMAKKELSWMDELQQILQVFVKTMGTLYSSHNLIINAYYFYTGNLHL